jgi:rod shape-determining protein MreC
VFESGFDNEQSIGSIFTEVRRLSFVILISISLIFLLLDRADADVFDEAREAITDFTSPIYEWISPPFIAIRGWFDSSMKIFSVYEENEKLKQENDELRAWKEAALLLEKQNARYEALLKVQVDPEVGYITGRVVTEASGPFIRTLVVNLGKRDGVYDGYGVIDEDGLVGRILGSGHKASRVLLLNDLNSHVPVVVEPGNYRAILTGTNDTQPLVEFLSKDAQVQIGDRVVTSGHGGVLPPGLPVGLVSKVNGENIRVKTFSNETRVEKVRILLYDFPNTVDETPSDVEPSDETVSQRPNSVAGG